MRTDIFIFFLIFLDGTTGCKLRVGINFIFHFFILFPGWDHWMRTDEQTKGRDCIVPELSRNRNIGANGATVSQRYLIVCMYVCMNICVCVFVCVCVCVCVYAYM
jgi:hypothetical protein